MGNLRVGPSLLLGGGRSVLLAHSFGCYTGQLAQSTAMAVTIDLSQAGTTRGTDTTTVPAVVLPRRLDTAHVILPNFSPGGNYLVSVTTDRSGASERATRRAVANAQ